jgi:hypothetical protein
VYALKRVLKVHIANGDDGGVLVLAPVEADLGGAAAVK